MVSLPIENNVPNSDEIEISLFGPGFGESIVLHYGLGKWLTIDCCRDSATKRPAPLVYFDKLGLDPSNCVTHNVITHPDADHLGGIAELFQHCKKAELVCPIVLTDRDLIGYITLHAQTDPSTLARNSKEIFDLLKECISRPPYLPVYVKQDSLIFDDAGISLSALAPSDSKVAAFIKVIAQSTPQYKDDRRAAPPLLPNAVSVAMLLKGIDFSVIFGSDLEEEPGKGWSTLLDRSVAFKSAANFLICKVPHHGSQNAHLSEFWERIGPDVIAILAPYKLGSKRLPAKDDIGRILSFAKNSFASSSFKSQEIKRLSRADKINLRHKIKRRDLSPKTGQIRIRIDTERKVDVKLFNAVHLSKVY